MELIEYAFSKKWTQQYNEGCITTIFEHFTTFYQCLETKNFLLIPYEDLININERIKWYQLIANFMNISTTTEILNQINEMTTKDAMLLQKSKFDESWCKKQRDLLQREHPFIRAPAAKVTTGHTDLFNKISIEDKNSVRLLHEQLWNEKVKNVTGINCYDDLRKKVNLHYFPN